MHLYVVICLKIRTFVVSATTVGLGVGSVGCCDLLENSYLCGISNNRCWLIYFGTSVVICLKIRTFVVSATTVPFKTEMDSCCDLLENSYLCGISNNLLTYRLMRITVVICLKIRTFVVSATTHTVFYRVCISLWFAWKFVPLWYQQQHVLFNIADAMRCDLLENSYLCGISNNPNFITSRQEALWFAWKFVPLWYQQQLVMWFNRYQCVVICLKIRTFVVSATTCTFHILGYVWLWFAWKFVPLWYQQQLWGSFAFAKISCDLLENSYLCGISNNVG